MGGGEDRRGGLHRAVHGVYEPALLMIGKWPHIIGAFITASCGIFLFAAGLHGYS